MKKRKKTVQTLFPPIKKGSPSEITAGEINKEATKAEKALKNVARQVL